MPHESKLFVGNLPKSFKQEDLKKLFGHFGAIESFKLCPKEKAAFAFVSYKNRSHANQAKKQLNHKTINKHEIQVDFARSSNDLHIKAAPKNKQKRKFTALTRTSSPSAKRQNKRRKIDTNSEEKKSQKQIPKSRIIKIINIHPKVSSAALKRELFLSTKLKYQYLIYPAKDSTENNMNVAWILHHNVADAEAMIAKLDRYILHQSILRVNFVRKLNKLYRVNIVPPSVTNNVDAMKQFINKYFTDHYKFDEEENKKSVKFNKYTRRKYKKKKKHDVIQNVVVKDDEIMVEFKKVDYALFTVLNMNGIEFKSQKTIHTHFELESFDKNRVNENKLKVIETKPETIKTGVSDSKQVILKMFNIAKSVEYDQLRELVLSIIDDKYYEHLIYPSPDSLPQSQSAWICLKEDGREISAHKIINQLNGTEINHETVGVVFMRHNISAQKIMIRNLPDSFTKDEIRKLFARYGTISDISMKEKRDPHSDALVAQHCGYAFVSFNSIKCAVNAMNEMNGHKIKNKVIAIDYTLPKEIYNKIRSAWNEEKEDNEDKEKEENINKKRTLYEFMRDDYEKKSFFSITAKQKNVHREVISIPIASEAEDYDWSRYFLYKHRVSIIQYETNCKIRVNEENIEIASCSERDLAKGVKQVRDMLNDKRIREVGYTQLMNIPFELEHADFDWIAYLNGADYARRKQFELRTGSSFTFARNNKLQIELIGATRSTLQRGVRCMKEGALSEDISDRQQQLVYKHCERIHFAPNAKIRHLNMRQIQKDTRCKIRIFGSHVFANRKNVKSYFKVSAKTEDELKNGCNAIRDCIAQNNVSHDDDDDDNKSFWFYSGDANEERTVFVRNLPFEMTNDEAIREKFAAFGNIVSLKLVCDKISGNLNGSCFIQFDDKQSALGAIRNNRLVTMNGRKLLIHLAVNKYEAKKMERAKLMRRDRRNLYLAKEGIMLNENEMKSMEKKELDRRIKSWKEKQLKLQNPNFHVSKTRLSVQNIPPFVAEKYLRKIFYEKAVQIRSKMEKCQVFEYPFAKINQVKIVRDARRKKRSKRFGFVEFREHSDALLVLRDLNNKQCGEIFDAEKESNSNSNMNGKLQVEFSVENMKKVHFHLEKVKNHQRKWQQANLEKLKDRLEILKAQNQTHQIQKVEEKIKKIMQNINNEKYLRIKEKKAALKMKKKQKDSGLIRKYKSQQNKKYRSSKGIKRQ